VKEAAVFRKLLIFGIIANLGVILLLVFDKKEAGFDVSWEPYTSKTLGFSLTYPKGWTIKEIERTNVESEIRFAKSEGAYFSVLTCVEANIRANLFRSKPERLKEPLIVACHEAVLALMPMKFGGFTRLNAAEMKLGPTEAPIEALGTSFVFSMRRGLMVRKMRGMVVSTWNGKKHIAFQFVCPECDYENVFPIFQTFLQSYQPCMFSEHKAEDRLGILR